MLSSSRLLVSASVGVLVASSIMFVMSLWNPSKIWVNEEKHRLKLRSLKKWNMTPHTHFFKGALLGQKVGKIFFLL